MSISSEITRIQNKRDQALIKVADKGVTVPSGSTIDDLPDLIDLIAVESTYSVSNSLTNVVSSNDDTKVLANGNYYAELTPTPDYFIQSITVTMDGIDVTEDVFKYGMGAKGITANGTYIAEDDHLSGYDRVVVNVPSTQPDLGTKSITANGTYTASDDSLDGYSSVTVSVPTGSEPTGTKSISISVNGTTTEDVSNYANAEITVAVPNSYVSSDEGKVVSNGALVSQTSDTVTQNGTVDTTLISSLTVSVPTGGGGTTCVTGTFSPSSNLRSVTLTDCIGKSNIAIYPTSALVTPPSGRTHYGEMIINDSTHIYVGSSNSGGSGWSFTKGSTQSSWDKSTGTMTIASGVNTNYGGYYTSGMTYGYAAW